MIGGTGTRLDHVMGNFGQLFYAHSKGVKAELVDANNRIRVLNHEDTISKKVAKKAAKKKAEKSEDKKD